MRRYIVKRLLLSIPILIGVVFIVFTIMSLTPGDPATMILGTHATPELVAELNHKLGYDRPFFIRFFFYLKDIILHFDFGKSYMSGRDVLAEVLSYFPVTIRLSVISMVFSTIIGVSLGVIAAVKQYSFIDSIASITAMLFAAIPGFWLGMMLIHIFSLKMGILPPSGIDSLQCYIMPITTLVFGGAAGLFRLTRAQMLEEVRHDYVRTARAKGASERIVIWKHALKNALLPVITAIGLSFASLLGGTVIVETVFGIPGIGNYMLRHILGKDTPAVMMCTLLLATMFYLILFLVDLLYAFIDPRIKAQYRSRSIRRKKA